MRLFIAAAILELKFEIFYVPNATLINFYHGGLH